MDGFRHVAAVGEGQPILFLHGWSAHGGFFAPQLELASSDRRIIVPDLPGHGRDRRPGTALRIADLSRALNQFIISNDLSNLVLVGWSMGAMVAFDYVASHGLDRLAAFVVVDMSARIVNDQEWRLGIASGLDAEAAEGEAIAIEQDWNQYAPRIVARLFAPEVKSAHPLRQFATAEMANNDGATLASLWRSLALADHRQTLSRISIPALVIAGARSQIYRPPVTAWMAARMPRATHHVIAQAGHAPQLEQADAFNAVLAGFVASTLG